jgi:hypothetical protein
VTGIGGVFFKSADPDALYRWYERHLGLSRGEHGAVSFDWREEGRARRKGTTVWGIVPSRTRYFSPSRSPFMLNYRVDDLEALWPN